MSKTPPPRLLVAEDDPLLLEVIVKALSEKFTVDSALTVAAAKSKLIKNHYDLASTDLNFDGEVETGLDLAKHIRKVSPDTKILLVSSQHGSKVSEAEQNGLIDDYLAKPAYMPELVDRVEKLLNLS